MKESSTYFSKEQRDEILKCSFVLKSDPNGNTALIANLIWRDYVDNIPKYMSKILFQLFDLYIDLFRVDDSEIFDITQESIKLLCSKFTDKFFMELFPHIGQVIEQNKNNEHIVYSAFHTILLVCRTCSEKVLSGFKADILNYIHDNMNTEFGVVSKIFASIIIELSYKFNDKNIYRNFVHTVMKKSRAMEKTEQLRFLKTVAFLVESSESNMMRGVVAEIFRKPYDLGFFNLFKMISGHYAKSLETDTEVKDYFNNLLALFPVHPEEAIECFVSISKQIDPIYLRIFMDKFREIEEMLINGANGNFKVEHMTNLLFEVLDKNEYNFDNMFHRYLEIAVNLLIYKQEDSVKDINNVVNSLVLRINKIYVDEFATLFAKLTKENFDNIISETQRDHGLEDGLVKANELISKLMWNLVDSHITVGQYVLVHGDDKSKCHPIYMNILEHVPQKQLKPFIMKICGPIIRVLTEKGQIAKNEGILETVKQIIVYTKDDIKLISVQLQSVILKAVYDTTLEERTQLKCAEILIRIQAYANRADIVAVDLIKNIRSRIFEKPTECTVEVEILQDIVRFLHSTLKPDTTKAIIDLVEEVLKSSSDINYEVWLNLFAVCSLVDESLELELDDAFLQTFTKIIKKFNAKSVIDPAESKELTNEKRETVVFTVKSVAKIVNKYRFFSEFAIENLVEKLESYEEYLVNVINETTLLKASNNITDGNVCIFLLSQGYLKAYDQDSKLRDRIIAFVFKLIENNKVNNQLVFNCLQMILLKEISDDVEKKELLMVADELMIDEDKVAMLEIFLKRIYFK